MSGQEISQDKTSIMFSNNVSRSTQANLQHMINSRKVNTFGKYLGVPLCGTKLKGQGCQYIVDQIAAKLNCCKKHTLALAGRITLAKSVIEAIPLYPMMTNKLPRACIDQIHKLQRRFMWDDMEVNKKLHAISWDTVTLPKSLGGTGLRDLNVLNQVCLMKLGWNMPNHSNDLWVKF